MAMPKKGTRRIVVDERVFCVFVAGRRVDEAGNVPISLVAHLESNGRAKLLVKGITSRNYWYDWPDTEKTSRLGVTITPRVMAEVIRFCLANGWDPDGKGQTVITLDNDRLKNILTLAE